MMIDKKYRASFGKMHTHECWVTKQQFTEFSSWGITGCHISIGRYGKNIKDDTLIIPLRQDLHLEFDKNQIKFISKYFNMFPEERKDKAQDKVGYDEIEVVKQMARNYYREWKDK